MLIKIKFAADLPDCPDCGESWCPDCEQHFADCACPGPMNAEEEGYELIEIGGELYGRR